MKLTTYIRDSVDRVGIVVADQIFDVADSIAASGQGEPSYATSLLALLSAGQEAQDSARVAVAWAQSAGDPGLVRPLTNIKLRPSPITQ